MAADPIHFLLVDDLEENLVSLEALLRREGLVLLKARSGVEALELLLKHEVALALLDVQMPGMDGFELAEMMRGTERTRRVPIIFLTAGAADYRRRFRGYEAGAVDFLQKPIEPDILRTKTEVFFELFRQRQQLARQHEELKVYARALEQADRRKDEFLAVLAHELRTPLTPIRYGLDLIRLQPQEPVRPELPTMMDRQLTHLVRLIDDLLDVSRISQGKIELKRQPITVQTVVHAAVESSRPLIEAGRHELTLELPEAPLWVLADLTRLAQVLSNLLNNAAKYTPPTGHIRLAARAEDGQAVIEVADNGIGIEAEMLPRVFDLFTQVEGGATRSRGGLGIGLALARQLVELHEGRLSVKSPGRSRGSTFTTRLPLQQVEQAPVRPPAERPTLRTAQPRRILVVDDDETSAEATAQILRFIGHEVSIAHDGLGALRRAEEQRPEAVILDLGLPGMSGYDICRALRQQPHFADALLIAHSGWGAESDRQRSEAAGFDHHLTKPVNFRELAALLEPR
ncbi:MAG: response regulator [Verrucomicrobia bacterium]|nr:response regulator [Verrucomicrobiota bacterium]